jgi:hypothetical protein
VEVVPYLDHPDPFLLVEVVPYLDHPDPFLLVEVVPYLDLPDPFLQDLDVEPLLHHQFPLEEAFGHLVALVHDHGHLLEASLDHPYLHMHHPLEVVDNNLPDTQQDHLVVQYTHLLHCMASGTQDLQEEASFQLPYRDNYNLRQQSLAPYPPWHP